MVWFFFLIFDWLNVCLDLLWNDVTWKSMILISKGDFVNLDIWVKDLRDCFKLSSGGKCKSKFWI